jgi:hypothetical protein
MYAIHANYSHVTPDGFTGMRQIPTFYLDERTQGIVSESHAVEIARSILTACLVDIPTGNELSLSITAVQI